MGANTLSWEGIKAWAELTRNNPSPFDIEVIKRIDSAYIEAIAKEKTK